MDAAFHESDERLELYVLGRLSDSEVIQIEEHLLVCDPCRGRLDETAGYSLAMRDVLREEPKRKSGFSALADAGWFETFLKPRLAFAGAMAVALVAVALVWNGHSRLDAPINAVATLQLNAMRGSEAQTVKPSRELDITIGDAAQASGSAAVEVVDANGTQLWTGTPQLSGSTARVKVTKVLKPGDYLARYYDSPGHLVHEYVFHVK